MPEKYLVMIAVGPDRNGLIAEITSVIASSAYNVDDMDQVVMHGIFILSLLIDVSERQEDLEKLKSKLESRCRELGLEVKFYYSGGK